MLKHRLSFVSHAAHYIAFSSKRPLTTLDKAALIFSIDVDVGSRRLGEKNRGENDRNVHDYLSESVVGRIEEQAIPLLLQAFNDMEVPATFALRGQLTEVDNSIIPSILSSPIKHDIGAHGYYHKAFTTLSRTEADRELEMISKEMEKSGIEPKSFVFPKNKVAHLTLLEKWGYLCFRSYGDLLRDKMVVEKFRNLYDIHPGIHLGECFNPFFLNRIMNIAVKYRAPLHVWFHPWNFGNSSKEVNNNIFKGLLPFLKRAREKQKNDTLQFETMYSIAEKQQSLRRKMPTAI